jgi:uncharacterized membrane-anchored protein
LPEYLEDQPPAAPRGAGLSLTDTDVGAHKDPAPPAGRFDRLIVVAAIVFQLVILITMIVGHTVPFLGAQTVLLRTEPVDPRDLFRGDYVTLAYALNRTPTGQYEPGQSVYVTLVPESDGKHYQAGAFLAQPPPSGPFIRGTAQGYGRVTYGIESYYVQEGTGRAYEQAVRDRRLSAEVALSRDGTPALRRLIIE